MIQHNHDLEILKQMAMADGILTENEKDRKMKKNCSVPIFN